MSFFFETKDFVCKTVGNFDEIPNNIIYLSFPTLIFKTIPSISLKRFYKLKTLVTEPFSNLDEFFHKEDLNIEIYN